MRREIAKLTVRPLLVVLVSVVLDDDAGLGQGPELLAIEALIPEATVEGLDEAVLPQAGGGAFGCWFS